MRRPAVTVNRLIPRFDELCTDLRFALRGIATVVVPPDLPNVAAVRTISVRPAGHDELEVKCSAVDGTGVFRIARSEAEIFISELARGLMPPNLPVPQTPPIVLIGASAGGGAVFRQIAQAWPADVDATLVCMIHRRRMPGRTNDDPLLPSLQRVCSKPVELVQDGGPVEANRMYLAPPGKHTQIASGHFSVSDGEEGDTFVPDIDRLFASGGEAYGARSVGVLLTGMLFDGVGGMQRITACGGLTLAQNPDDAREPSMPLNAILHDHPSYVFDVSEFWELMREITATEQDRTVRGDGCAAVAFRAARLLREALKERFDEPRAMA